jgi:hypothetical protein
VDIDFNDVSLKNILTSMGAVLAEQKNVSEKMKKIDEKLEKVREIVAGPEGRIEESFSYRIKNLEDTEKNCPINDVKKIYDKLAIYGGVIVVLSGIIVAVIEIYFKMKAS